ncbi:iron-containing alcohol dehydrogenase [Oscillibacter sp.]|uniref:iron-containing alcohol dehydrogenase n=1 Tax=Oscillibacter sp. TaxID=1945593 RepID=UPI0028A1E3E8|nr:iron-containing alcohol dehydrogenase [Oscillibacter sp.]
MENFNFYSPTYFVFGKSTETQTGEYVDRYGGHKALIHYGGGSVVRSGLLDRVKASLDAAGIAHVELGGVKASPHSDLVYEGIELARKEGVDFVLAIGGGSVMDSAKAIALGAVYNGDFWDFYCGKQGGVTKALPVGTVVTIAASGSEGSTDSVITLMTEDGKQYKRCADGDILRPLFAIMNPELMVSLPPYQTASGIADIMAHCMERYFTHSRDVELTDRLLEAVMLTMIKEGRRVTANPNDYEARANIMWAAMIAQNNSTGVGRAQDWGTHHMDNELGILYGCSHGAGLALLFPYWMEYAMKSQRTDRFVLFATRVWGCQLNLEDPAVTAMEGIKAFRSFMRDIGMPASIGELGGKPEDIPVMVENMFHGAPNHGNFVKLTPEIAAEIYRMAM